MKNYKKELEDFYKDYANNGETKLEFTGDHIFEFTTYSSNLSELLAQTMIDVMVQIANRTTFEYIEDEANHVNYILMINMPFLSDKIEWGTSVRGAWFDDSKPYDIYAGQIRIKLGGLSQFLNDLIEWINNEN